MGEAVFAFIDQLGRWKPVKDGQFRIIRRGKRKGQFLVKYLVRKGLWRNAIVATVKVLNGG